MIDTIHIEGLRFAYPPSAPGDAAPWVVDGLDLRVRSGEWLAVMGASDAGKTTLCLLLAGLAPHGTGGTMEGRIFVGGLDIRNHPPPAIADSVGILFQEPEAQLFNATVEAEVAWGLENLGLPVPEIRSRLDEVLLSLRLDHTRFRSPSELSGGEKKRLALASVLAMRPSVLVLDEPMGGLDPLGRREILATLSRLRHQSADQPVTIVMTESDPEPVAAFSDRLAILHQGKIALEGTPRALFQQEARMSSLGVAIPQMARLASCLNKRLDTSFAFLSVDDAETALAVHLG
jgi:energy-coupling factor transporter ATP-binding protein EcfA2